MLSFLNQQVIQVPALNWKVREISVKICEKNILILSTITYIEFNKCEMSFLSECEQIHFNLNILKFILFLF